MNTISAFDVNVRTNTKAKTQPVASQHPFPRSVPAWKAYGVALLTTLLALGTDLALRSQFNEVSSGFYILAATFSTWYAGYRSGVLVVVLTNLATLLFYKNPHFSLAFNLHSWERVAIFTGVSLLVSWLTDRSRRAEAAYREINRELEERVKARTAALEESNRQLEDFSYSLAHDLRGPLRTMEGFAVLLNEEHASQLDEEGREYARKIAVASDRVGHLILDLLAYARLAKAESQSEKIQLDKLADYLLKQLNPEIEQRHAVVEVTSSLPSVMGDLDILKNALVNLISNALKFVPEGKPPHIRIWAEKKEVAFVRLWVEDNGIGIEPRYQGKIFGVFERLHDKDTYEGTGIGLAMVKKGVERMGGKVGLESTPGKGSRFWMDLPAANETAVHP